MTPHAEAMDPLDLTGRIAAVTGASAGIGAATVRTLAAHGATVAFCARHEEELEALAAACEQLPGEARPFVADMADAASVERFCDGVEAQVGSPDTLVNNVGASPSRNFLHMTDDDWNALFDLNVMSAVRCTRRFLPAMRSARFGRVVMVSSVAARPAERGADRLRGDQGRTRCRDEGARSASTPRTTFW